MVRWGLALGLGSSVASGAAFVAQNRPEVVPVSVTVQAPETPPSTTTNPSSAVPTPSGGGVGESMMVAVTPGGPVRVDPGSAVVTLHRDDPGLAATVGPVRVVDPRGTLAGWNLRVRVAERSPRGEGRLEVRPGPPTVVDGEHAGLVEGSPGPVRDDRWITLMSARQGHGGGTYQVFFVLRGSGDDPRSVGLVFDVS